MLVRQALFYFLFSHPAAFDEAHQLVTTIGQTQLSGLPGMSRAKNIPVKAFAEELESRLSALTVEDRRQLVRDMAQEVAPAGRRAFLKRETAAPAGTNGCRCEVPGQARLAAG